MAVKPSEKVYRRFPTYGASGENEDVDALPSGSLLRNNVVDSAVTVTISHIGTGDYSAEFTLPATYVTGDDVQLRVDVVKNTLPSWDIVWQDTIDTLSGVSVITIPERVASNNAPLYSVGEVAYLKESAQIGHLEAVRISGMLNRRSQWLYTINSSQSLPVGNSTYGDRTNIVNGAVLYFSQSEFVDLCTATRLAIAFHQSKVTALTNKYNSVCG